MSRDICDSKYFETLCEFKKELVILVKAECGVESAEKLESQIHNLVIRVFGNQIYEIESNFEEIN